jgi:uncharacterized membrane protein YhhN
VTAAAFLWLTIAGSFAVLDWIAVGMRSKPLEYLAKPAVMLALLWAVTELQVSSGAARTCFEVALVCCLVGDVFLMLPDRDRFFVFGLGAFLLGHLAYIPGLWLIGVSPGALLVGAVLCAGFVATIGLRLIAGATRTDAALRIPVTAYTVVISAMVASAVGTRLAVAILGAGLFYCSDALIGWNAFVKEHAWGPLAIIVTYHVGQIFLALSLI